MESLPWIVLLLYMATYSLLFFVLARFGLLTAIVALFFTNDTGVVTLGADWRAWYAPYGLATLALLVAIALFAFWRSLAGRELLGDIS